MPGDEFNPPVSFKNEREALASRDFKKFFPYILPRLAFGNEEGNPIEVIKDTPTYRDINVVIPPPVNFKRRYRAYKPLGLEQAPLINSGIWTVHAANFVQSTLLFTGETVPSGIPGYSTKIGYAYKDSHPVGEILQFQFPANSQDVPNKVISLSYVRSSELLNKTPAQIPTSVPSEYRLDFLAGTLSSPGYTVYMNGTRNYPNGFKVALVRRVANRIEFWVKVGSGPWKYRSESSITNLSSQELAQLQPLITAVNMAAEGTTIPAIPLSNYFAGPIPNDFPVYPVNVNVRMTAHPWSTNSENGWRYAYPIAGQPFYLRVELAPDSPALVEDAQLLAVINGSETFKDSVIAGTTPVTMTAANTQVVYIPVTAAPYITGDGSSRILYPAIEDVKGTTYTGVDYQALIQRVVMENQYPPTGGGVFHRVDDSDLAPVVAGSTVVYGITQPQNGRSYKTGTAIVMPIGSNSTAQLSSFTAADVDQWYSPYGKFGDIKLTVHVDANAAPGSTIGVEVNLDGQIFTKTITVSPS